MYSKISESSVVQYGIRRFSARWVGMPLRRLAGALLFAICCCLHAPAFSNSQSNPNKPGPMPTSIHDKTSESIQQSSSGHPQSDTWVISAEVGVAIGTLLLVWVTSIHVQHFKRLVERIERIYELQSSCRIAISLVDDQNSQPQIWIQNIGQVPVAIAALNFQISDARDPKQIRPIEIVEIRHSWMVPSEKRLIRHIALDELWSGGSAQSVIIDCSYLDIYPAIGSNGTMKKIRTVWELDHGRKNISLLTEN